MIDYTFLFVTGLHRSGTSLLFQSLRENPQISAFADTGVPEDEGQHLQDVYPPATRYGGPGRFGFAGPAHLTEQSPLATAANAQRLFAAWAPHWNLALPVLMEKSPQDILQTRLLQAFFPHSVFVVLTRHPVAVSLATQKWRKRSLYSLLEHWLVCHEQFAQDQPHLRRVQVVQYEKFVAAPNEHLDCIANLLGLRPGPSANHVRGDVNRQYFEKWDEARNGRLLRRYFDHLAVRFEDRCNRFGYSLKDCDAIGDLAYSPLASTPAQVAPNQRFAALCRLAGECRGAAWSTQKSLRKQLQGLLGQGRARKSAVH